MAKTLNLIGKKFNRLSVIQKTEKRSSSGGIIWLCKCDCGNLTEVEARSIKSGHATSCGCYRIERVKIGTRKLLSTHGLTGTREYNIWANMIQRCTNQNSTHYHDYGGRGIIVCDEWMKSFEAFICDMGAPPTGKHTIDRKNNNGNYEPGNCRWVMGNRQQQNRRDSRWWYVDGVRYESSGHAARELGINTGDVFRMCNGGKTGCYSELKYPA